MAWEQNTYGACGPDSLTLGTTLTQFRLFRWSNGTPGSAALCGSGVGADGVTMPNSAQYVSGVLTPQDPSFGYLATRGLPVRVESGGAFAAGANLQSDGIGRAIGYSTGPVVLRALQAASGAGEVVWAVFA